MPRFQVSITYTTEATSQAQAEVAAAVAIRRHIKASSLQTAAKTALAHRGNPSAENQTGQKMTERKPENTCFTPRTEEE